MLKNILFFAATLMSGFCASSHAQWRDVPLDGGIANITGKATLLADKEVSFNAVEVQVTVLTAAYPLSQQDSAIFKLRLPRPITTDKVRITSNEPYIRIAELGIYEPGMPKYPNPLAKSPEGLNVPNYAASAELTASSFFGGFTPEKAVDGKADYESRWVSGDVPPHSLVVDMKEPKNIGYIQMLTGHPTGDQWTYIAKDFTLQYWDNGKWIDLKGVRQQDEPGTMGLIIGSDANGYYCAAHSNESHNWFIEYHSNNGSIKRLADAENENNLLEGHKYILKATVVDNFIGLYCNGELMVQANADKPVKGGVGVWSCSSSNSLEVSSIRTNTLDAAAYNCAGDVQIMVDKKKVAMRFVPDIESFEIQLPSVDTREVVVMVQKAIDAQQILIDGKPALRQILDVSDRALRDIIITIISADGKHSRDYKLTLVPIPPLSDYKLIYADEFDGDALDIDQWYYRIGGRWNSVQSKDNVQVAAGNLEIELTYDPGSKKHITGGIITKKLFGYGYYETRANLWKHRGWHSAFWQSGYNPPQGHPEGYTGPANNQINEIDGFESVEPSGFSTNLQYHNPRMLFGSEPSSGNVAEGFHIYGWEWTPQYVRFFFDGRLVRQIKYLPPHGLQNVWLSCVAHDDAELTDIPGKIYFDYFRYYSRDYGLPQVSDDAVIMDVSSDAYFEKGDWKQGRYALSYTQNVDTRFSENPGNQAGWRFAAPATGSFELFTWNPYIFTDGPVNEANYTIKTGDAVANVCIDPMEIGQSWVSLGKYEFEKGIDVQVVLSTNSQGNNRINAIMLKPLAQPEDKD